MIFDDHYQSTLDLFIYICVNVLGNFFQAFDRARGFRNVVVGSIMDSDLGIYLAGMVLQYLLDIVELYGPK